MIENIFRVIAKICGVSFGLALIGIVIMWFGAIPMVAAIFDQVSGWFMLCMFGMMVLTIGLIIKFIIDR